MERLPKDLVTKLALELDLSDILNYCRSSKKFNNAVCDNFNFWRRKYYKEMGYEYTGEKTLTAIKAQFEMLNSVKLTVHRPILVKEPLKEFLLSANYGENTDKIKSIISGLLQENILSVPIIGNLLSKWLKSKYMYGEGQKKFFELGDPMRKYLNTDSQFTNYNKFLQKFNTTLNTNTVRLNRLRQKYYSEMVKTILEDLKTL